MEKNGDNVADEHWAPVGGALNKWIQVGWREEDTCQTDQDAPGGFATTGYLMCCLDPAGVEEPTSADTIARTGETQTTPTSAGEIKSEPTIPSSMNVPIPLSPSIVDPAVQLAIQDSSFEDDFKAVYKMLYNRVSNSFEPVPHNRFSGWSGHKYSEALDFCKAHGSKVPCPYEALCPSGTGEEQPVVEFLSGPVWSPMDGKTDAWVEIRDQGQCTLHTSLDHFSDVTRYVVCCKTEPD